MDIGTIIGDKINIYFKYISFLKFLSSEGEEVWNWMHNDLVEMGHLPEETSITDKLMSNLSRYSTQNDLPVVIRKAKKESQHGNDLDLYFARGSKLYMFPTQAKKMYQDGQYQKLFYKDQVENLIDYSVLHNGYPLYMLYNFPYTNHIQPNIPLNGITLTNAYNITFFKKDRALPTYSTLHPAYCFPFKILVQDLLNSSFQLRISKIQEYELKPCNNSIQHIMSSSDWKRIQKSTGIHGHPDTLLKTKEHKIELPVEEDKYLIIIGVWDTRSIL